MPQCFTNVSDDADYWNSLFVDEPWSRAPAYKNMRGFNLMQLHADILHVFHLGIGRDLVGCCIVELADAGCFGPGNAPTKLAVATARLKSFAKERGHPLKLKKLTRSKLAWKAQKFPELLPRIDIARLCVLALLVVGMVSETWCPSQT